MTLNLFEKIGLIFKTSFTSILYIEVVVIFLLLFLFLLFNFQYKRKIVPIFISSLLLYFLISFIIAYAPSFFLALRAILKKILEYFYFSPIPIYFGTILITSFCFVKTMFSKSYTKRHKILSYVLLMSILFCFAIFTVECWNEKIHINEITEIYQNELVLSLIQVSQFIFFLYIGSCLLRRLYHKVLYKFVK